MFAATLPHPILSLARLFSRRRATPAEPKGPMPSWTNDAQLSEQLLKDTGLSPEDLGIRPTYDQSKPFFMQQTFW